MKKSCLIILLTYLGIGNIQAQFSKYAGFQDVMKLKQTTTYVVLSDSNEIFNEYMKEAVKKEWKITEYKYILFSELDKYSNSENNSFIILTGFYASTGGSLKTHFQFYNRKKVSLWVNSGSPVYGTDVISVQIGGKDFSSFKNWLVFCYAGDKYMGANSPKMANYIKLLNNSIQLIEEKKLEKLLWKEAKTLYNSDFSLKEKTIIFWKNEIPLYNYAFKKDERFLDKEKIREKFKGNVEIADDIRLKQLIDSKDTKYLYLGTFVEGTFSVIYLYDANGKIYYFGQMGRMAGENTYWFEAILKKMEKELNSETGQKNSK
jgi:hypothetical protein